MAVVDNNASSNGNSPPRHSEHGGSNQSWFKKNKKLAVAGAVGIGFLLLSHKGAAGTTNQSASQVASDAAAEQAAIDQAVGAASQTGDLAAGSAAGGGGGDTGSGSSSNGTGDTVASAAGPGPTVSGPAETITVNEAAPNITVNNPSSGLQTPVHSAALTTGAAPGDVVVHSAAGETVYGTPAQNQAAAKRQAAASEAAAKHVEPPKPVKKGTKSAAMTIAHPTKPKTKTKGSVMKYGRAFPTAQSVHVGRSHTTTDGVLHEPVTVNYGGYSETHMSHNRGESWTDNVPGYTPPSRGMPLIRLGTA